MRLYSKKNTELSIGYILWHRFAFPFLPLFLLLRNTGIPSICKPWRKHHARSRAKDTPVTFFAPPLRCTTYASSVEKNNDIVAFVDG